MLAQACHGISSLHAQLVSAVHSGFILNLFFFLKKIQSLVLKQSVTSCWW